jgi:hypothetical protein
MSSVGGGGGGGGGGGADGGGATADPPPPPPPQPNNGTVMPTPKAIKTSRRFALTAGAAEDSRSFDRSFTLIDFTPTVVVLRQNISSCAKKESLERILANGEIVFCYVI